MTEQPNLRPTAGDDPTSGRRRKPLWRRWWAITAYVLVALGIVGSFSDDPRPAAAPLTATTTAATAPGDPIPSTSSASPTPSASPVDATTAPTTRPAPPAPAKPKRVEYQGRGAKVLTIAKPASGAVLVTLSHSGRANFVVWTLGDKLKEADLLVNTIGRYRGTVLMDAQGEDTHRLKIEADGAWKVSVVELSAAPRFGMGRPAQGTGDAVLIYTGAAGVITSDHRGQANFVVTAYSDDAFPDLIVNEIGRYHGEGTIGDGPQVISVQADGRWALRVS